MAKKKLPLKVAPEDYRSNLLKNSMPFSQRLMVGIPLTGTVRAEWMIARYGQIIPTNWGALDVMQFIDTYSPLGFMVADARNAVVHEAIEKDMEWLLFIDHDVILPADTFIRLNDYMRYGKHPVVSGIYFTKSEPSEPLIYRGRGNSFYDKWLPGDKVWVDGIPMGICLINVKLLRAMYEESEEYSVGNMVLRKVFETPKKIWNDPSRLDHHNLTGTEDLAWCTRVMEEGFLEKAGFPEYQKKQYPFLMDTNIFCRHIDPNGQQFPKHWQDIAVALKERQLKDALKK